MERQSIYTFTNKYNERPVYTCQIAINSTEIREGRKKSVQVTKGSRGRGRTAVSKVRDFLTNLNITGVLRARTGASKLAL